MILQKVSLINKRCEHKFILSSHRIKYILQHLLCNILNIIDESDEFFGQRRK